MNRDITFCEGVVCGVVCKLRNNCYRWIGHHKINDEVYLWYGSFSGGNDCNGFDPIVDDDE